jgi:hypothetical protein
MDLNGSLMALAMGSQGVALYDIANPAAPRSAMDPRLMIAPP